MVSSGRAHAARFSRRLPDGDHAGVSGYRARDEFEVGALSQTTMVNVQTVLAFTRAQPETHGAGVVETLSAPAVTPARRTSRHRWPPSSAAPPGRDYRYPPNATTEQVS